MKKQVATAISNWFYDTYMKNQDGIVSIDDFSRKFTEIEYKQSLSTEQYLNDLKVKGKTDAQAYDQLVAYARQGYLARLMHRLVMPVRYYYEHEKDEQGNPVRLIYSIKRDGKRGWTFINFKDPDFFNQTQVRNMMMTDAYTDNEKKLWEKAKEEWEHGKTEKEKRAALESINLFIRRGRRY